MLSASHRTDPLAGINTRLAEDRPAHAALERARSATRVVADLSPIVIERFTRTMREKLTAGEIPFRKAYLASLVDRIEVDDREARIVGRKESAGTGSPGDQSRPDRC